MMTAAGIFVIEPTLPRYSACSFTSSPISPNQPGGRLNLDSRVSYANSPPGFLSPIQIPTSTGLDVSASSRFSLLSPPPKYEDLFGVVRTISPLPSTSSDPNERNGAAASINTVSLDAPQQNEESFRFQNSLRVESGLNITLPEL